MGAVVPTSQTIFVHEEVVDARELDLDLIRIGLRAFDDGNHSKHRKPS